MMPRVEWEWEESRPAAVGMVPTQGRGSLPFALIHGEPLVRCATVALEHVGVEPIDVDTPWSELLALVEAGRAEALVLHDPLCPLVPPSLLEQAVRRAVATGSVVVAARPVTDTVKQVAGGLVGATLDRAGLRAVVSPVVLPAPVLTRLDALPAADLPALVAALVERGVAVEWVDAPSEARRIGDPDDLVVLEALSRR